MQEFGLRNSEGHKINKPLSGLLVYRRIMPSAERLSTNFPSCPVAQLSQLPSKLRFSANCSFFRTIFQPGALSSHTPAAERGLFTNYYIDRILRALLLVKNPVMFYQNIKPRKSVFYCFWFRYIIKQCFRRKCRKHSPAAHVFYISFVFSNARRVLPQCNTRLRLLYLLILYYC